MNIQLAYRFTGEDEGKLLELLKTICRVLETRGHAVHCPCLDPEKPKDKKELFAKTLRKLEDADVLLVLVKSGEKSEGMLIEIGYAMGIGKKTVALISKKVQKTHLRELVDEFMDFADNDEIENILRNNF